VFSTACRAGDVASDAPCRTRRSPAWLSPHRHSRLGFRLASRAGRQTRFHRRLVKDDCFHESGRLPSTSAPSARLRRLHWKPATGSRLCRRVPASDARSPLRWGETRPDTIRWQAKRRSSTSAIEHDPRARPIESPEPRSTAPLPLPASAGQSARIREQRWKTTPLRRDRDPAETRPRPRQRPSSEHSYRAVARTSHRAPALARDYPLLRRAIQPRCHGSGAGTLSLFPAPPVAIARNESFAPTRSARAPAVVKLAAMPAGEASTAGHTRADVCPCRAHRADLLARGPPSARDHLPYGRCSEAPRRSSVELTMLPLIS